MKLKNIKKKVMYYAGLLGVDDIIRNIYKFKETDEQVAYGDSLPEHDIVDLYIGRTDDVTILHELLHVIFKNTYHMTCRALGDQAFSIWKTIHEQEIERMALNLAAFFEMAGVNKMWKQGDNK